MNSISKMIQTTEKKYPQIYAYTLPGFSEKEGWVKVGETTKKDVRERILEQVKTAAFDLSEKYHLNWVEPAFFADGRQMSDRDVHTFYIQHEITRGSHANGRPSEWFYFDQAPEKSLDLFKKLSNEDYSELGKKQQVVPYVLREEQKQAVELALSVKEECLWNAKPRFGKTLATYDLAKRMDAKNVLVITNRPAIAHSWYDDFEKFIGHPYYFVSESPSLKGRNPLTRQQFIDHAMNDPEARQINFVSLQDLKGSKYFGGQQDKLHELTQLNWDLLVIDEAHEGVDTLKTEKVLANIKRSFTLHLSGTPFRALAEGKFSENQIFNWSYADEQEAKANWNMEDGTNPYETLPTLSMFTYELSEMIVEQINQGPVREGEGASPYAFNLGEFFATDSKGEDFIHRKYVERFLDSLTTHEKFPFSTYELRNQLKHTFWILDRVQSARALKKMLEKHPVFENYHVLLAVGDEADRADLEEVRSAVKRHDRTITLSVGQLTTGVTVPEWTGVMMLSNMKSPSSYMQAAFRSQNPWSYTDDKGQFYQKENAYVFDFAPERSLEIFDEFANNLGQDATNDEERRNNVKRLLNFFPVIGEDENGRMVELNTEQVLTIPHMIQAKQVVKAGFIHNYLFSNIAAVFHSTEVRGIIGSLKHTDDGHSSPKDELEIDPDLEEFTDGEGNINIPEEGVISSAGGIFGPPSYGDLEEELEDGEDETPPESTHGFKEKLVAKVLEDFDFTNFQETYKVTNRVIKEKEKNLKNEVEEAVDRYFEAVEIEQAAIHGQNLTVREEKEALEDIEQRQKSELKKELESRIEQFKISLVEEQERLKLEELKKEAEDDTRSRLRGFTRTIPAFLMAYGEDDTRLKTLDQVISDDVFQEVTGITLDQFKVLRDEYQFFNEAVFDRSIQEFLSLRKRLSNYFDESQTEDIFDYIPRQETNQIFTPKSVVREMIDELEAKDPSIFTDSNRTFADLYVKSGLYLTEIVKRLYKGLKDEIPNDDLRLKHILENQIYGFAPSEIIYRIAHRYIFGFDETTKDIDDSHIVMFDTTPFAKGTASLSFEEQCNLLFKNEREEQEK